MAATLNTGLTWISWTNIMTGGIDTDVVKYNRADITLFMGLHIDLSLFGKGYDFSANFQVIEVATNQVFNNYWNGKLDSLAQWAPSLFLSMSYPRADWTGIRNSHYAFFGQGRGDGLYLYRPYFLIYAGVQDVEFIIFTGKSQFAVSEEHFLILETSD